MRLMYWYTQDPVWLICQTVASKLRQTHHRRRGTAPCYPSVAGSDQERGRYQGLSDSSLGYRLERINLRVSDEWPLCWSVGLTGVSLCA